MHQNFTNINERKMKKITLNLTLTLLFSLFATQINATTHNHGEQQNMEAVGIQNPWVRSAPPNAPALGAFMEIYNNSDKGVKLLSASASGYKRLELHRSGRKNGMMTMVRQDFVLIPAHEKLVFKPSSWHIMMIKPEKVPKEGSSVAITLVFDNGLSKTVNAMVRKAGMMKDYGVKH
ncbi:Copper metallochaperone, bacterial analog of Cox17 protein [uncultured Gammaproteobacteria bacterium]|jgi:copper(I)-binding protein|nr:Copper metallochaperone, bacterial analog of Cox17 protein [uncultured Gammaproteobacteria bacterium]CAC9633916.1 Copper metallochaperone, bacterial analog of Cox17 protein [uncultured Gammaproteobacteria bacterium]CAC9960322.1 Copper metallochaperone, bacterial analog of Cox17 protein [uncultured Gammaproteobacteria bacterium]SHE20013.1 Copper metallochaperone, bacterial analog of Cox17 protein [Bathymodiolus brooksi thiotrophic gill symbiont]